MQTADRIEIVQDTLFHVRVMEYMLVECKRRMYVVLKPKSDSVPSIQFLCAVRSLHRWVQSRGQFWSAAAHSDG